MIQDFLHMDAVKTALNHPSYAVRMGVESYQALETVGDAILDHLVAKWLYGLGVITEKDITNIRSRIVSNKNLAKIGKNIGLNKYLKVDRHRITPKDVADCLEAVIGALSIELGQDYTEEVLKELFIGEVHKAIRDEKQNPNKKGRSEMNAKNRLQEYVQGIGLRLPDDLWYGRSDFNGKTYKVSCYFVNRNGQKISTYGVARTIKESEKKAASFMLQKLNLA